MGYLLVLGYILFVGVATFLMKIGLKSLSPYQLNFLIGIGMLLTGIPALLIAQKSLKLPSKEVPLGLLIGIMMSAGAIFYVVALDKLSVSVASVLASTYVLLVVLLSVIFLKEGMDFIKILGILLTFTGTALLIWKA